MQRMNCEESSQSFSPVALEIHALFSRTRGENEPIDWLRLAFCARRWISQLSLEEFRR